MVLVLKRLFWGLIAAVLGVLAVWTVAYVIGDNAVWLVIAPAGILCGALGFLWGQPFVEWLNEKTWWWPL